MKKENSPALWGAILAIALAIGLSPALADGASETLSAGGLTFYLGVVPAEVVRGHPPGHPESKMHGGAPSGRSMYHVMVAVFDARTGQRVTDAQVRARVEDVGVTSEEKPLEPMSIADAMTYGNFFRMAGRGTFRIGVEVRRPGASGVIGVQFEHKHR